MLHAILLFSCVISVSLQGCYEIVDCGVCGSTPGCEFCGDGTLTVDPRKYIVAAPSPYSLTPSPTSAISHHRAPSSTPTVDAGPSTVVPTLQPSFSPPPPPTVALTPQPLLSPSPAPSTPNAVPTPQPAFSPSPPPPPPPVANSPTPAPTPLPSAQPPPTPISPTSTPTAVPTLQLSFSPSPSPSRSPTIVPTSQPSFSPSPVPTAVPTAQPIFFPPPPLSVTSAPTNVPTPAPTPLPSSAQPTSNPTPPTPSPTVFSPSVAPSIILVSGAPSLIAPPPSFCEVFNGNCVSCLSMLAGCAYCTDTGRCSVGGFECLTGTCSLTSCCPGGKKKRQINGNSCRPIDLENPCVTNCNTSAGSSDKWIIGLVTVLVFCILLFLLSGTFIRWRKRRFSSSKSTMVLTRMKGGVRIRSSRPSSPSPGRSRSNSNFRSRRNSRNLRTNAASEYGRVTMTVNQSKSSSSGGSTRLDDQYTKIGVSSVSGYADMHVAAQRGLVSTAASNDTKYTELELEKNSVPPHHHSFGAGIAGYSEIQCNNTPVYADMLVQRGLRSSTVIVGNYTELELKKDLASSHYDVPSSAFQI